MHLSASSAILEKRSNAIKAKSSRSSLNLKLGIVSLSVRGTGEDLSNNSFTQLLHLVVPIFDQNVGVRKANDLQ